MRPSSILGIECVETHLLKMKTPHRAKAIHQVGSVIPYIVRNRRLNIDVIITFNFQIAFLHTLGNLRTYRDQVATVSCGSIVTVPG